LPDSAQYKSQCQPRDRLCRRATAKVQQRYLRSSRVRDRYSAAPSGQAKKKVAEQCRCRRLARWMEWRVQGNLQDATRSHAALVADHAGLIALCCYGINSGSVAGSPCLAMRRDPMALDGGSSLGRFLTGGAVQRRVGGGLTGSSPCSEYR